MKKFATLVFALAATVASPAFAGTTIFTGDTTAGPTYNRPLSGRPPTGLSGVGTAVRYVVTPFTVSVSGSYNFLNSSLHDSFFGVHSNAFNPANGLLNALAYDDDAGPGTDSLITGLGLLAGVSYFAVSSGFDNSDFGRFTLTVDGPGNIVGGGAGGGGGVPEPATWAMLIFGFAGVGMSLRRRRGAVAVTA
ncbi:MAG: PEPxxWA-CTERM sorting domain-containing protein [Pseudomonadota bacterium]